MDLAKYWRFCVLAIASRNAQGSVATAAVNLLRLTEWKFSFRSYAFLVDLHIEFQNAGYPLICECKLHATSAQISPFHWCTFLVCNLLLRHISHLVMHFAEYAKFFFKSHLSYLRKEGCFLAHPSSEARKPQDDLCCEYTSHVRLENHWLNIFYKVSLLAWLLSICFPHWTWSNFCCHPLK